MDLYMRAECAGFLQAAVLETVLRLLESKQSAELNPAKMDSPDDACSNAEFLLQILDQVRIQVELLIYILVSDRLMFVIQAPCGTIGTVYKVIT